jgi:hypothetical protein
MSDQVEISTAKASDDAAWLTYTIRLRDAGTICVKTRSSSDMNFTGRRGELGAAVSLRASGASNTWPSSRNSSTARASTVGLRWHRITLQPTKSSKNGSSHGGASGLFSPNLGDLGILRDELIANDSDTVGALIAESAVVLTMYLDQLKTGKVRARRLCQIT